MDIEVKGSVELTFEHGDVFVSDDGYGYVLHKKDSKYILYNLCGSSYWIERDTKVEIDKEITKSIKQGVLNHYPKSRFKLVIEEIK